MGIKMDVLDFQNMMIRIYAIFGKTKPNNEIMNGIYESVEHIPDSAIPGIIEKFEELPELKASVNIVMLIKSFYTDYTEQQRKKSFHCRACNNRGYFWGVQELPDCGGYSDFISLCPNCTKRKGNYPTYLEMVKRGAMVMPPNYKGSVYAWAKEKYGIELHKRFEQQ